MDTKSAVGGPKQISRTGVTNSPPDLGPVCMVHIPALTPSSQSLSKSETSLPPDLGPVYTYDPYTSTHTITVTTHTIITVTHFC